ncbi:MAG: SusD/RagB family nutrient-binding outer membrane lipoprotein [Cyclobacteriaceae bacterium]
MKNLFNIKKTLVVILGFCVVAACDDKLTEMNINPNGIDPATANPNLLMPAVLAPAAQTYLDLGFGDMAGTVQHTQKNGWFGGHNHYDWGARDWSGWYGMQRTNALLEERAIEMESEFFQGVSLTMKSFIFGNIADLWGDAPYTDAVKGTQGGDQFQYPVFDSQETIYLGIIEDLKTAATLFASGDNEGVTEAADLYFGADPERWQRFANSLLLRYYMRISEKRPDIAKPGIEAVYNSGMYIESPDQDATLDYTGGANDVWPSQYTSVDAFTRWQASQTLIDQMLSTNDPRISVWFEPVAVQWVADPGLATDEEAFIRADGQPLGVDTYSYLEFQEMKDTEFTRRFNPNEVTYNDDLYVGLPPGLTIPASYNGNPQAGQGTQNQHVSQLAPIYSTAGSRGSILKARIISAAEVSFILSEAALLGYTVGSAEDHYNDAIQHSLTTWGKGSEFSTFIAEPGVTFDGTIEQVISQKWVASWTAATEAWMDYRRTGFPALQAGPAAAQPVVAVRFTYGNDELNNNTSNTNAAVTRLEITPYSGAVGANSQWSKPWVIQGTGEPW